MIQNLVRQWGWPFVIIGGGLLLLAWVWTNSPTPWRPLLTVGYLLICPGMSWVQLLQIENLLFRWTLAVALSIALTTIVGIILLYTTLYTPLVALLALVLIGSGGIVTNWLQSHPRSTTPYELMQVATSVPPQLLLPAPKADGFSAGPVDESV